MSRRGRCANDKHDDELLRGGRRVKCRRCGDEFPCRHACDHTDCRWERDEPGSVIRLELGFDVPHVPTPAAAPVINLDESEFG